MALVSASLDLPILRPATHYQVTVLLAGLPRSGIPAELAQLLQGEHWKVLNGYGMAASISLTETHLPDLTVIEGLTSLRFALDLLHAMRAHEMGRRAGAIVIGHAGQEWDEIRALEAGADDFIAMPLHRDAFLARVRGIVGRARLAENAAVSHAEITNDTEQGEWT